VCCLEFSGAAEDKLRHEMATASAAGAYTRPLLGLTWAVSDTKYTQAPPKHPSIPSNTSQTPPERLLNATLCHRKRLR